MEASSFLCSKLGRSKTSGGSGISTSISDPSSVFSGSTSRSSLEFLVVLDVVLFLMFSQSRGDLERLWYIVRLNKRALRVFNS